MPEFVEWMLGFPLGWTEGERRTHRLRMLGNAVQVQVAEVVGLVAIEEAA
jgi:site-specific DNA-cytosine methylase